MRDHQSKPLWSAVISGAIGSRARAGGILLALIPAVIPALAIARPWIEPGDIRARHSIQWLADQGCFTAPMVTWPIMWADVSAALDRKDAPAVCTKSSAWRYLRAERNYHARETVNAEIGLSTANRGQPLFRDFGGGVRDKATVSARVEGMSGPFAAGLAVSYTDDSHADDSTKLDGSYLAGVMGNWVLGVGAIDRWWGPGWHSSVSLSTNARPVPSIWLNRKYSQRPSWPFLSWIGPWNFVAFAGQLESDRAVPDAKLVGARFSFRPLQQLEIGLTRTALLGGEGRQSFNATKKCAAGKSNTRDRGSDPCDQRAGVDLRLSFPLGSNSLGLYTEYSGEDEAGGLPSHPMGLVGIDLATAFADGEQRFYLEHADTTTGGLWGGNELPNYAYENGVYLTGYRFEGRNIASTWEGDARVSTLGANHFFRNRSSIALSFSHAELNRDDTLQVRPPDAGIPQLETLNTEVNILTASYQQLLFNGELTLSGTWTDKEIITTTQVWPRTVVSAEWVFRFQ